MKRRAVLLVALVLVACPRAVEVPDASVGDAGTDGGAVSMCPELAVRSPSDPLGHGRRALGFALTAAGATSCPRVALVSDAAAAAALTASGATLDARPESYVVVSATAQTWVIGRDATGAMYGAFELAERVTLDGAAAATPAQPIAGAPAMPFRAANPFLVLPAPGEAAWWFHDEAFWVEYLDLLARARMNVVDVHGMYNLQNTVFPNVLLYFGRSTTHPQVGVPEADRLRNVAMLRTVVRLAGERGIKVSVMSYRADGSLTGDVVNWPLTDAELQQYTREAVKSVATEVPGLWRLGFRIGESGRAPSWYRDAFVVGLQGTGVKPYTRTWVVTKADILSLVGANSEDWVVQAKLNGEHLGAPYAVAGGTLTNVTLPSYSYEDYLEAPMPYAFVFQMRTCSTHRIFRYASYERTVRTVPSLMLGPSRGYTFEPPHAFFPQRDYYHRPEDRFSEWTFRRDELMYLLFGRLSYDPATPERVFRAALARRVGTDALWPAVQGASDIVPWMQMALTCGFDHRDYAPELELGGSLAQWAAPPGGQAACIYRAPFDTFAIAGPFEAAADLAAGRSTLKLTPLEIAAIALDDVAKARAAASVSIDPNNAEARDVVRETIALADLGEFFAHRLRAATALAVYRATGQAAWLAAARSENATSAAAFTQLAADTAYIAPFEDRLRMSQLGLTLFHWSLEVPRLADDVAALDAAEAAVTANPPVWSGALPVPAALFASRRPAPPAIARLDFDPPDGGALSRRVSVGFVPPLPVGASVTLWWKRFANVTDFAPAPMAADGGTWSASIVEDGPGGLFAVEVTTDGGAWRLPDVTRETPYRVLLP